MTDTIVVKDSATVVNVSQEQTSVALTIDNSNVSLKNETFDVALRQTLEDIIVNNAEVNVTIVGNVQGPPGPTGSVEATSIAGFPIDVALLRSGDLLEFDGSAWTNSNKTIITDGGNF